MNFILYHSQCLLACICDVMWTRNGISPWVHHVCHRMPKALSQLSPPEISLSIALPPWDMIFPLKQVMVISTIRGSLCSGSEARRARMLFFFFLPPFCFTSFPSQRALAFHNFITLCGSFGFFSRFLLPPIWQSNSTGHPTKVLGSTLRVYVEKLSTGMEFSPGDKREATKARSTVSTASTRVCIPNLATSLKLRPLCPPSSAASF